MSGPLSSSSILGRLWPLLSTCGTHAPSAILRKRHIFIHLEWNIIQSGFIFFIARHEWPALSATLLQNHVIVYLHEYHPLWVVSFHSLHELYARHRQRRFVEYHVFIHQNEYHRVWVLFFPFPSTRGRQRCFCVECRVFIHQDEYHPFRAVFSCAFSPPRVSRHASSATMMFRGELTRAFVAKELRVFTLSAAKEELSGSL